MHDTQGNEITLTHYGANEVFGELSPIDSKPRSASAAAAEALEVLALSREDFLRFLDERPQIGIAMMRSLSQRLRNTTTYLEEFKPAVFETAPVEKGEDLRRGASDLVANIIDSKLDEEEETPPSDTPPPPPTMGIFDRIATPPPKEDE
ncbi:MAG: cyclic nucleotide-binding domain-containing protein [Anaerolineae bacterium]|nr:cyclic nucleotide-binding domain-containing protein [Anaerolineae bacterium]